MAIGGFDGTDPWPTLAGFQQGIARGEIHYFIAFGGGGIGSCSSSNAIAGWVESYYTAGTVGGVTVCDLST